MTIDAGERALKREFLSIFQVDLSLKETKELQEKIMLRIKEHVEGLMESKIYEDLLVFFDKAFDRPVTGRSYQFCLHLDKVELRWIENNKKLFEDLLDEKNTIKDKVLSKKDLKAMQSRIFYELIKKKTIIKSYVFESKNLAELITTKESAYWSRPKKTLQAAKVFSFEKTEYNEPLFFQIYKNETKRMELAIKQMTTLFQELRATDNTFELLKSKSFLEHETRYRRRENNEEFYLTDEYLLKIMENPNKTLKKITKIGNLNEYSNTFTKENVEILKALTEEGFEMFLELHFLNLNLEKEMYKTELIKRRRLA
jgi:hypothetical protein